jgi:hypothetical protein
MQRLLGNKNSIVPDGTDALKNATQHFVLGYLRRVPPGQFLLPAGKEWADRLSKPLVHNLCVLASLREVSFFRRLCVIGIWRLCVGLTSRASSTKP